MKLSKLRGQLPSEIYRGQLMEKKNIYNIKVDIDEHEDKNVIFLLTEEI